MTTAATPLSLYQLRIVLRGMSPLIWCRVLVHSHTTLAHLHTILQILFAWSDEHLHSFHIHGKATAAVGPPIAMHPYAGKRSRSCSHPFVALPKRGWAPVLAAQTALAPLSLHLFSEDTQVCSYRIIFFLTPSAP
jgi:hypothetical protein